MSATPSPISGLASRLSLLFLALVFAGVARATTPVAIANEVVLDNGAAVELSAPAIAVDPTHNGTIVTLGSAPVGTPNTLRTNTHNGNV